MYWPADNQHPGSICCILPAVGQSAIVSIQSFDQPSSFPTNFRYFPDESVVPDSSCTITLHHIMQGRRKRASTRDYM